MMRLRPDLIRQIKSFHGWKFVPENKGGPGYSLPKEIEVARRLKEEFGPELSFDKDLNKWATVKVAEARELSSLSQGTSAELTRLPEVNYELHKRICLGPRAKSMTEEEVDAAFLALTETSYQTADVAFMARSVGPLNANQPGTGKTPELIAMVDEEGLTGPKMVVAPVTALDTTWLRQLLLFHDDPIFVAPDGRLAREAMMEDVSDYAAVGRGFWLVLNPAMITYRAVRDENGEIQELIPEYPEIFDIEWDLVCLDEFHKMGMGNPGTLTYKAFMDIKVKKKVGMSGTPVGGKPEKLWAILHWMHPEEFKAKWRFVEQWLEVKISYDKMGREIKTPGQIRKDRESQFYEMLSKYMVRRTKAEVAPWLPPKDHIAVTAVMGTKQKKQYETFAKEAEVRIGEEMVTATSILAEYTRLKQFANAVCDVRVEKVWNEAREEMEEKLIVFPTPDSCKLEHLMQILEERGIRPVRQGAMEGEQQVVVFSQFTRMVDMVNDYLNDLGIPSEKITGDVSRTKRTELQEKFQAGKFRVLICNTMAAGVSIELDKADTVVFLDETWNPDDQEQAEDRVHRTSRIHQVTVYTIRTKGTIEEKILERLLEKEDVNKAILDLHRKGLRAV